MKIYSKHISYFILISVMLCGNFMVFSQINYDEKISQANLNIYDNPNKAIETGLEVYNAAESSLEQKLDALLLIATAYTSKRNYILSLEYLNKSLQLLPQIESDKFKIKVLNKLGAQYQQLKAYDKALEFLDEALGIANESKEKNAISNLIGFNHGARGFIYREQMSCEIALSFFNKSLYYFHDFLKTDQVMNANISIINYNKGNCFVTISKIDSAKVSYNKAIQYAEIIDAKSLQGFAKKGLAEVYTLESRFNEAIVILDEGLAVSSEVGDLILNMGIYKGLSDNYLAIDDREMYLYFKEKFETTRANIKTTETATINNSLSRILEENEAELILLNSKNKTSGIVFFIIHFVLGILIIRELILYLKKSKVLKNKRQNLENSPVLNQ